MTGWLAAALALVVGGLVPAFWLAARGGPVRRLIGVQLTATVLVPVLLLLGIGFGRPSYLVVPVVLVVCSFAGTLVYTRLLKDVRS